MRSFLPVLSRGVEWAGIGPSLDRCAVLLRLQHRHEQESHLTAAPPWRRVRESSDSFLRGDRHRRLTVSYAATGTVAAAGARPICARNRACDARANPTLGITWYGTPCFTHTARTSGAIAG